MIDDNEDITKMLQDFFEIKDIEYKIINEDLEELNDFIKTIYIITAEYWIWI